MESDMVKLFITIAISSALMVSIAAAQEITFGTRKSILAKAGHRTQIAALGRVTPDCHNAPVKITLAKKPLNGKIEVNKATLRTGAIPKCPKLQPESAVFFYTSNPGFKGRDEVAIIVVYDGKTRGELYEISVE